MWTGRAGQNKPALSERERQRRDSDLRKATMVVWNLAKGDLDKLRRIAERLDEPKGAEDFGKLCDDLLDRSDELALDGGASSSSANTYPRLTATNLTSNEEGLTSPHAFLFFDRSTMHKTRMSFVGRVRVQPAEFRQLTFEFSDRQYTTVVIKPGSPLYDRENVMRLCMDGDLFHIKNVFRGNRSSDMMCLLFDYQSSIVRLSTRDGLTWQAICKFNRAIDRLVPDADESENEEDDTKEEVAAAEDEEDD